IRTFTYDYNYQRRKSSAKCMSGAQQILKTFLKIEPGYHTNNFVPLKIERGRWKRTFKPFHVDAVCDCPDFFGGDAGIEQALRYQIRNRREPLKSLERHTV